MMMIMNRTHANLVFNHFVVGLLALIRHIEYVHLFKERFDCNTSFATAFLRFNSLVLISLAQGFIKQPLTISSSALRITVPSLIM
jgi:hypothetical protein